MADLNDVQRQAVRDWVKGGASLSDVQKRLLAEYGLSLTYMDVRLLVLELGATVQDKQPPKQATKNVAAQPEPASAGDEDEEALTDEALEPDQQQVVSKINVSMDRVVQVGALASGDVVFSDGVKARWFLDQYGRLGLTAGDKPGYRPPQEDLQDFQVRLQELLSRRGY